MLSSLDFFFFTHHLILVDRETFELLTGFWAFRPEATNAYSAEEDHLSRILELTGEKIPLDLLMRGRKSPKYFSPNGQ